MPAWRVIAERALNRFLTLLALTIFSFFMFEIVPQMFGMRLDVLFSGANIGNVRQGQSLQDLIQATIRAYDLNGPPLERLGRFLWNMFTLHFGNSVYFKRPVTQVVLQYLPNTLILSAVSLVLISVISVVTGVVSAKSFLKSRRKIADKAISLTSLGLYFIPVVWISIIMYIYFAAELGWFPINLAHALTGLGAHNYTGIYYYLRYAWAATLPILVLTITGYGNLQQLLRNNIIEEYTSSGYVEYARARGLDENTIFYKHALRNAILPWVTVIGISVAFLIYGVFFVEVIFQFPGIGYASVQAATTLDIPFLISTTFIFGVYTLAVLFLLDFVYAWLDPRIRFGEQ